MDSGVAVIMTGTDRSSTPSSDIAAIGVAALLLALIGGAFFGWRYYVSKQLRQEELVARLRAVEAEKAARQQLAFLEEQSQQKAKLRLIAWNIESGGNDPAVIAEQLATDLERYDIYGLTEVHASNTGRYLRSIQDAHGDAYQSFVTVTGRGDRMMIVYDSARLEALENAELEAYDGVRMNDANMGHRSPLMARFRVRSSDVEFIVVLNHLARGKAEVRQEQAKERQ